MGSMQHSSSIHTFLQNSGQGSCWIPLLPWPSPESALEPELHDFWQSFICNKMELLPKLGVLEHKLWWKTWRDVDSWLEGNLLYVLTLLFLKLQTCCSWKQCHHLADHLLSNLLCWWFSIFLVPSFFITPFALLSTFHLLLPLSLLYAS